jgi:hypothetical protein
MNEVTLPGWACEGCGRALPDDPEGYRLGYSYGFGAYDDGHPDGSYGDGVFRYWCGDCTDADVRRDEAFVARALTSVFGGGEARGDGRR